MVDVHRAVITQPAASSVYVTPDSLSIQTEGLVQPHVSWCAGQGMGVRF